MACQKASRRLSHERVCALYLTLHLYHVLLYPATTYWCAARVRPTLDACGEPLAVARVALNNLERRVAGGHAGARRATSLPCMLHYSLRGPPLCNEDHLHVDRSAHSPRFEEKTVMRKMHRGVGRMYSSNSK